MVNWTELTSREFRGHQRRVHCVKWSADGRRLASGSADSTARVWSVDAVTGASKSTLELRGHTAAVHQLCWDSISSDVVATASSDKSVRIWDARVGKSVHCVATVGENINCCWSPDGQHIAVGDKTDNVSVIDVRTSTVALTKKFPFEVNECSWDCSGQLFLMTTGRGTVLVTDIQQDFATLAELRTNTGNAYCIAVDVSGRFFAVGGADASVTLWDAQDFLCLNSFGALEWPVRSVTFSQDAEFIASASEDLAIDIASTATGETVHRVKTAGPVASVAWHPRLPLLAYTGDEQDSRRREQGTVRIIGAWK